MKHKRKCVVLLASMLVLGACGHAKYAALSDSWNRSSGYEESPLDETTYQVTYHGDATLDAATVDRYALFRCAELTIEKGYDYFIVKDGADQRGSIGMRTRTQRTSFETVSTPKTVRLFKGTRPADNENAYDARSTVKVMGPTIER